MRFRLIVKGTAMPFMWVFCLFFAVEVSAVRITPPTTVISRLGTVDGWSGTSRLNKEYLAWTNIPYARAKRFEAPVMVTELQGDPFYAQGDSQRCLQFNIAGHIIGNEDCLFLNVYRPKKMGKHFPVLFYIHGGNFENGGFHSRTGTAEYFMDYDVVLVTIQYRLNVFGFLTLENEALSGNWGLKDQAMALKWVNAYISDFGGDPTRVVAFGESAGGASVHYLLVAESTNSLLAGGIATSGSINPGWGVGRPGDTRTKSLELIDQLNCTSEEIEETIRCLTDLSPISILKKSVRFCFRPVQEVEHASSFISKDPLQANSYKPLITSFTNGEYLLFGVASSLKYSDLPQYIEQIVPVCKTSPTYRHYVAKILNRYFPNRSFSKHLVKRMLEDEAFVYPGWDLLMNYKGPKYAYHMEYRGEVSFLDRHLRTNTIEACHADELFSWFNIRSNYIWVNGKNQNSNDSKVSKTITQFMVQFATTLNPSIPGIHWTPFKSNEPAMLRILPNGSFVMEKSPAFMNQFKEIHGFWSRIFCYPRSLRCGGGVLNRVPTMFYVLVSAFIIFM